LRELVARGRDFVARGREFVARGRERELARDRELVARGRERACEDDALPEARERLEFVRRDVVVRERPVPDFRALVCVAIGTFLLLVLPLPPLKVLPAVCVFTRNLPERPFA
jgi:hypothetical protein